VQRLTSEAKQAASCFADHSFLTELAESMAVRRN